METTHKLPKPETIWRLFSGILRFRYWSQRNLTSGSGDDGLWYDLAREVTARVASPHLFVDAQFRNRRAGTRPPTPRNLLAASAFDRYMEYRARERDELVRRFEIHLSSQRHIANCHKTCEITFGNHSLKDAVRFTFRSEGEQLSPLFSYLWAKETVGCLTWWIEDQFVGAVLQYVPLRDEYDEAWGETIPHAFRTEAPDVYRKIFSAENLG